MALADRHLQPFRHSTRTYVKSFSQSQHRRAASPRLETLKIALRQGRRQAQPAKCFTPPETYLESSPDRVWFAPERSFAYAQASPDCETRAFVNQLVQSEPSTARPPSRPPFRPPTPVWQIVVLAGLCLWLYWSTLGRLIGQWWHDPNFSHGFFVPLFSGFVVWQERDRLARLPIRPSWSGLPLLILALLFLIIGQLGAELFLARSSLHPSAGRTHGSVPGMEHLPRHSVSLGVSVPDDPHPDDPVQPDHLPAATAGIASGRNYSAAARRSHPARGQRH